MKQIKELESFRKDIKGDLLFDYDLKKRNWFNIGGKVQIYFKPETLNELVLFIKKFSSEYRIFTLGAGSNILLTDDKIHGAVIKLGKNFSNISLLSDEKIIAGSACTDKQVSDFAMENNIGGLEFLSCIPGTIGGGLRMNSGCFGIEFRDILLSVQALDEKGNMVTIPSNKINFGYRYSGLDKNLIFLSASLKGKHKPKNNIKEEIIFLKDKKNKSQPTKIKTGGSTFKNPINQTKEKVWELIKKSVPSDIKFGDAEISQKHCNFFVNSNNATFKDMKSLIEFVQREVKSKTGIEIETEIEIIN